MSCLGVAILVEYETNKSEKKTWTQIAESLGYPSSEKWK